jgi:glycolate oxidase
VAGIADNNNLVLGQLIDALDDSVFTDQESLAIARADRSGKVSSTDPLCVVKTVQTEDVAIVMQIANRSNTPVVVRGGGSGLAGGAIGSAREVVFSLEKMNRILEISTENRWAHVEARCIRSGPELGGPEPWALVCTRHCKQNLVHS